MRQGRSRSKFLAWALVLFAANFFWAHAVHAQTRKLLRIITAPDVVVEQAALDALGPLEHYEGLVRWGIVQAEVDTVTNTRGSILLSTGIDAFTMSPFPDYNFYVEKISYETGDGGGYPAVWEGELKSQRMFGGGRVFARVSSNCDGGQWFCLRIHAYPYRGILDRLLYSRVIAIIPTSVPEVYATLEIEQNAISSWWSLRTNKPYN